MAVILSWGGFVFETLGTSLEKLHHKRGARWKRHNIIGRRPAGQYLGPADECVEIEGCVWPWLSGAGSAAQLKALADASEQGLVAALCGGGGDVFGAFFLEKAPIANELFGGDGQPQKLTYTLTFGRAANPTDQVFVQWP